MTEPVAASAHELLVNASVLVFLFRALAGARSAEQNRDVSAQLLSLLSDFLTFDSGLAMVAGSPEELASALAEAGCDRLICDRLKAEGAFRDAAIAAVPIYASGTLNGALVLRGVNEDALPVMTAIASLASVAVESVREVERLRESCAALENRIFGNGGILGRSAAILKLIGQTERLAVRDTTVLIQGETGTGKELVARLLHQRSARSTGPFVAINCAAIADSLLESELFGYEKGAFTGAAASRKGKLEAADKGTLFLDEIGELALPMQAKMLRVLQEREVERIGATRPVRVDIRLIAATNRDLASMVEQGTFRGDLYHRLNVVALRTSPLRERREDIPLLARHFLANHGDAKELTPEAARCLEAYDWPGNVRELANAMEHAAIMGDRGPVTVADLPESVWDVAPRVDLGAFQTSVSDAKRESILRAYQQAGGDYKGAAKLLGLNPTYLLRLVRNLGLREALRK
jgi:transcriptional regulator with PAS, ATPase and Fis domain